MSDARAVPVVGITERPGRLSRLERRRQRDAADRLRRVIEQRRPELIFVDYFDTLALRRRHADDPRAIAAAAVATRLGLTAPHVAEMRRLAERAMWQRAVGEGFDDEYSLDDVAVSMYPAVEEQFGGPIEEFVRLMLQADLNAELALQMPNEPVIEVLAAARGSRLAVVSDFYLPGDVFGQMVKWHRLDSLFEAVVVSCDHRVNKASGRLYPVALEHMGANIDVAQVLMVGDHATSDVANAEAQGFSAFHMPGPRPISTPRRVVRAVRRRLP